MNTSRMTIAVDGYSSCGKSTLAKDIAKQLQLNYIDTGAMYRCVTLFALRNNLIDEQTLVINVNQLLELLPTIELEFQWNQALGRSAIFMNGEDVETEIRLPRIASFVSQIAAIKEVRVAMVSLQRKMGQRGGVILDGRDIASVVFPNADLKLFVTADPKVRAERRLAELRSNGVETTFEDVYKSLLERDHIDSTRAESPLIQVEDAIVIDTTFLTKEEQVEQVKALIQNKK